AETYIRHYLRDTEQRYLPRLEANRLFYASLGIDLAGMEHKLLDSFDGWAGSARRLRGPSGSALNHGDFTPGNVVHNGRTGRIGLIDLDRGGPAIGQDG